MAFTFTADDQKPVLPPRKPCKPGTYDAYVREARTDVTKSGEPKIYLQIGVLAPRDRAPEGEPHIDYHVKCGTSFLTNFLDVFAPDAKGKEGEIDDDQLQELIGDPLQVVVGMSKPQDGYEQRAEIKLLKKPRAGAKKHEVTSDD